MPPAAPIVQPPDSLDALARWLLLLVLGYSVVLAFTFVLHYFDAATRRPEAVLPLRTYWRIYANEWWYTLAAGLLYPFGLLPRLRPLASDRSGGPPIVLLHGYGMNRSCMFALYWRLRRLGYRNLYPLNLRPLLGTIEQIGTGLAARLYEIAELNAGREIHVIAHSMAGIVCRWCLADDTSLPVAGLVTLGSPHHGTRSAVLVPGEHAVQLRWDSPFLATLGREARVRLVSIYSELDNVIIPSDSSRFGQLVEPCLDGGHLALLFSARTFARVQRHLPAPGDSAQAKSRRQSSAR